MPYTWIVFTKLEAEIYGIKCITISPKARSVTLRTKAVNGRGVVTRLTYKDLIGVDLTNPAHLRERLGVLNILTKRLNTSTV
jgi:hypothetical protein